MNLNYNPWKIKFSSSSSLSLSLSLSLLNISDLYLSYFAYFVCCGVLDSNVLFFLFFCSSDVV